MIVVTDLSSIYKMIKPFPSGLAAMVAEFQSHIARIGLQAISCLEGENVKF